MALWLIERARSGEAVEVRNLRFDGGAVGIGERFGGLVVRPFLGGFVERLVVLVQFVFERFRGSCFWSFALSRLEMDSSAPAMANVEDARSLRSTSVMRERWLAGSAWRLSRRR